jgi:hypothetical protein
MEKKKQLKIALPRATEYELCEYFPHFSPIIVAQFLGTIQFRDIQKMYSGNDLRAATRASSAASAKAFSSASLFIFADELLNVNIRHMKIQNLSSITETYVPGEPLMSLPRASYEVLRRAGFFGFLPRLEFSLVIVSYPCAHVPNGGANLFRNRLQYSR